MIYNIPDAIIETIVKNYNNKLFLSGYMFGIKNYLYPKLNADEKLKLDKYFIFL